MGHKVNPNSFRLRNSWNSFYNFKDNNNCLSDLYLVDYIKKVFYKKKIIAYNIKIFKNLNFIFIFFNYVSLKHKRSFNKFVKGKSNKFFKGKDSKFFKGKSNKFFKGKDSKFFKDKSKNKLYWRENASLKKRLKKLIYFNFFKSYTRNIKIKFFARKYKKPKQEVSWQFKKVLQKYRFNRNLDNIIKIINLGFEQNSMELLMRSFYYFVPKSIRQFQFYIMYMRIFHYFFSKQGRNLRGFRLELKGRIKGKMRKNKKRFIGGALPLSTVDANIKYGFIKIPTKFGTFGFRVWLFATNKAYYEKRFFNCQRFKKYLKYNVLKTKKNKIQKRTARKLSL